MAKLNTIVKSKTRRIVVYGPPKAGKTLLAGAMAEKMNVLYFGLENGHNTLFQLPEEWQSRIEVIALPDSKTYPIAIETMMKVFKGDPCTVCEEHGKVNCPICTKDSKPVVPVHLKALDESWVVVMDSATQLTASAISNITKGKPDDYKMLTDDWGSLGKHLEAVFSQVQAARYNIVVLSHEIDVADEKKPEKLVPLAGSKNFSRNFAKYFDDVVHCKVTNKKHSFGSSTGYSMSTLTGSRSNFSLEDSMEPKLLDFFYPEEAKQKPKVVVAAK
jgi:hypothetical protein